MAKSRAKTKSLAKNVWPDFLIKRLCEGSFILVLTSMIFVLLSLCTFHVTDPSWSHASSMTQTVANAGGQVGAYIADALYFTFGYFAYFLPICLAYITWIFLKGKVYPKEVNKSEVLVRFAGFLFLSLSACGILSLNQYLPPLPKPYHSGGLLGESVGMNLSFSLNLEGAHLFLCAMLLAGLTWLTGLSWLGVLEKIGFYTLVMLEKLFGRFKKLLPQLSNLFVKLTNKATQPTKLVATTLVAKVKKIKAVKEAPLALLSQEELSTPPPKALSIRPKTERSLKSELRGGLPNLNLLDKGVPGKPLGGYTHQELETVSRELEQHLLDFGIQADVVAVHPGPVITRFELQLAAGIKVSRLTTLAKDLARSLSVTSVRVVEVIPGKTVVGLELPNQNREIVRLSDVLSADVYLQAPSPLTIALGVDIAGRPMVVDLGKMPHLLVAGTTGSGKSVGINAMILSLIFRATPEQVRLIMIDPKMLELSVYDGIPHLLTPVVTDMKEAASALRWCVAEMERRYRLMSAVGVRNLAGFNTKIVEAQAAGDKILDPLWKPGASMDETAQPLEALPYVVVIIDELADMMMVVGKKVEQLIARIAQKARAAGIHMVLATQRPSVDVLTGLIKSNIPTRISFQVSSKIDSRTILDQQGAEQLLGHGDMLYLAPGTGAPLRIHGAFVDDKEVHRIADDWRARGAPEYIDSITQMSADSTEGGMGDETEAVEEADPLFDAAVEFVLQTRKASISSVQRRFKIGYNRAARLIEEMERIGLVGPLDGGYRDVLAPVDGLK